MESSGVRPCSEPNNRPIEFPDEEKIDPAQISF